MSLNDAAFDGPSSFLLIGVGVDGRSLPEGLNPYIGGENYFGGAA